jgi:hypothetical protein
MTVQVSGTTMLKTLLQPVPKRILLFTAYPFFYPLKSRRYPIWQNLLSYYL